MINTDQEFRQLLRDYEFLCDRIRWQGRYRSEMERDQLRRIANICANGSRPAFWNTLFANKPMEVAHRNLNKWWMDRRISLETITLLDQEYRRFMEEIEELKRDDAAGIRRSSLLGIVTKIGVSGSLTVNQRKESPSSVTNPRPQELEEEMF